MNEFQAAMGLCILHDIDSIIQKNEIKANYYFEKLHNFVELPKKNENSNSNFAYFPIILKHEEILVQIVKLLNKINIFPRRYFYPSLHELSYIEKTHKMPISNDVSKRILTFRN